MSSIPSWIAAALLLAVTAHGASATRLQDPPVPARETIRFVDVYGLRSLEREAVLETLDVRVGDTLEVDRDAAVARLRALECVDDAVVILMAQPGNAGLLVGVKELGSPRLKLRERPDVGITLPAAIHEAYQGSLDESLKGMYEGVFGAEVHDGYELSLYGPAREHEERLVELAGTHAALLQAVLRLAVSDQERAVAAHALAYLGDKQVVGAELSRAITDPSPSVRNNAVRALTVLAEWCSTSGLEPPSVDQDALILMLDSLDWTDRNKASALLSVLSLGRPPELLDALRARALPALEEMALWSSRGHAEFAMRVLYRLAGYPEADFEEVRARFRSMERVEAEAWVRDALRRARADEDDAPGEQREAREPG